MDITPEVCAMQGETCALASTPVCNAPSQQPSTSTTGSNGPELLPPLALWPERFDPIPVEVHMREALHGSGSVRLTALLKLAIYQPHPDRQGRTYTAVRLKLGAIARYIGKDRTAVKRYIKTLVGRGMLYWDRDRNLFSLTALGEAPLVADFTDRDFGYFKGFYNRAKQGTPCGRKPGEQRKTSGANPSVGQVVNLGSGDPTEGGQKDPPPRVKKTPSSLKEGGQKDTPQFITKNGSEILSERPEDNRTVGEASPEVLEAWVSWSKRCKSSKPFDRTLLKAMASMHPKDLQTVIQGSVPPRVGCPVKLLMARIVDWKHQQEYKRANAAAVEAFERSREQRQPKTPQRQLKTPQRQSKVSQGKPQRPTANPTPNPTGPSQGSQELATPNTPTPNQPTSSPTPAGHSTSESKPQVTWEPWDRAHQRVQTQVKAQVWTQFFQHLRLRGYDDDRIVLELPDPFFVSMFKSQGYLDYLGHVVREVTGKALSVQLVDGGSPTLQGLSHAA